MSTYKPPGVHLIVMSGKASKDGGLLPTRGREIAPVVYILAAIRPVSWNQMRAIHPFPARMAPEAIAKWLRALPPESKVLDPMCGSGVVLRQSAMLGHRAIGFDIDPLAVLMSKVWTRKGSQDELATFARAIAVSARRKRVGYLALPWVKGCTETQQFIEYWFADPQRTDLARIARSIRSLSPFMPAWVADALNLALSRTIVTKKVGSSLAWDVSHSRPHRVHSQNDYDVIGGFVSQADKLASILQSDKVPRAASVSMGDCRNLRAIKPSSIDAVITSPPYLNAIDYLRGHKIALVWMGYTIPELRRVRSSALGTERAGNALEILQDEVTDLEVAVSEMRRLPSGQNQTKESAPLPTNSAGSADHAGSKRLILSTSRQRNIARKYAADTDKMIAEVDRVLAPSGKLIVVLADSFLRGVVVPNCKAFEWLANRRGFSLCSAEERDIPHNHRYLPMTSHPKLAKRMRKETVQVFARD